MLPFLSNKKSKAGYAQDMIVKDRKPDQSDDKDDPKAFLKACAQDLIDAIKSENVDKVAQVLEDTFEMLDSQPHEEGPHTEEGQE